MMTRKRLAAALVAMTVLGAQAVEAGASAFYGWQVANVPWGDTLNVRKYPASHSQKQAAYPNGTPLQMTGRCTKGLSLDAIAGLSAWQQSQAVRYRWCEVWHDPTRTGDWTAGWVYGRYISPY